MLNHCDLLFFGYQQSLLTFVVEVYGFLELSGKHYVADDTLRDQCVFMVDGATDCWGMAMNLKYRQCIFDDNVGNIKFLGFGVLLRFSKSGDTDYC